MAYNPDLKVSASNPLPMGDGTGYDPALEVSATNRLPVGDGTGYNPDLEVSATNRLPVSTSAAYNPDLEISASNPLRVGDGTGYNPDLEVSATNALAATGYPVTVTLDYTALDDTVLRSTDVNDNFGAYTELRSGRTNALARDECSLLKWDISSIPDAAIIQAATLRLWVLGGAGGTPTTYIHASLVPWYEGDGNDSAPSGDGSTWDYRNYNGSVTWGNGSLSVGYDFATTPVDDAAIVASAHWEEFDVLELVKDWHYGHFPNYGLWLVGDTAGDTVRQFASSEYGTANLRPELVITYQETGAAFPTTPVFEITTTSVNSGWTLSDMSISDDAPVWRAYFPGDTLLYEETNATPYFDFDAAGAGTKRVKIFSSEDFAGIDVIGLTDAGLTSITVDGLPDLATLYLGTNPDLASITLTNLPTLQTLNISGAALIDAIDFSDSPYMNTLVIDGCAFDADGLDALFATLDASGVAGGYFYYSDQAGGAGPTAAALTAYSNLLGKGWHLFGKYPGGFAVPTFWLPLNEASGNRTDSVASKVFAVSGAVGSATSAPLGVVADSDGSSGFLRRAYDADLAIQADEPFSLAFWHRPDSATGFTGILSMYDGSGSNRAFVVYQNDLTAGLVRYTAPVAVVTHALGAISTSAWKFFVVVADPANDRIGASVNGGAFSYTACATHSYMGSWGYNLLAYDGTGGLKTNAKLSRVALWRNKLLSLTEVKWLYNSGNGKNYADL